MEKKKKKRSIRREIIEWTIIIGTGVILYATGLHTPVIGAIQGFVLETGIIKPKTTDEEIIAKADYNFKLVDKNGNFLDGSDLKGKTLFINFWATWCPPCIAEMPDIHDLYQKMGDREDLEFIMISLDDDFEKARNFVDKKGFDFGIYQFASPVPRVYSSKVIPTTYVISPDGNIVVKKEGMAKYDTKSFKDFLDSLHE